MLCGLHLTIFKYCFKYLGPSLETDLNGITQEASHEVFQEVPRSFASAAKIEND